MDDIITSVRRRTRGVADRLRSTPDNTGESVEASALSAAAGHRTNAMGIDVPPVHGRHCNCARCLADTGQDAA